MGIGKSYGYLVGKSREVENKKGNVKNDYQSVREVGEVVFK